MESKPLSSRFKDRKSRVNSVISSPLRCPSKHCLNPSNPANLALPGFKLSGRMAPIADVMLSLSPTISRLPVRSEAGLHTSLIKASRPSAVKLSNLCPSSFTQRLCSSRNAVSLETSSGDIPFAVNTEDGTDRAGAIQLNCLSSSKTFFSFFLREFNSLLSLKGAEFNTPRASDRPRDEPVRLN